MKWKKLIINPWDKFHKLTIIQELSERKYPWWTLYRTIKCKCDCWNEKEILLNHLTRWNIKSCGCLINKWNLKHWMCKTNIYNSYSMAKQRCENKNCDWFNNYWWRWIKFLWNSFEDFYKDMWKSYIKWLTIDRINSNWNYCKSNCKWSTKIEQWTNRRTTIFYKWKSIAEWSRLLWIKYATINSRRRRWQSVEDALKL